VIINVKRIELLTRVKKVAKASAPPGRPLAELSCILIEADGQAGVICITATNLEIAIRSTMHAAVEKGGSAVAGAKFLLRALEMLPGEDVYIEQQANDQLLVTSGQPRYLMSVLPVKNYPKVEIPYPGGAVAVKGLKSLITRSVFAAAAPSPVRPAASAMKLTFSKEGVSAACCDGMCAVQVRGDPDSKGDLSILAPASSMRVLASIASDGDVYELGVTQTGSAIKDVVFSDGETVFSARAVEGGFPDLDAIFSSISPSATACAGADKLRQALDDMMCVAGPGGNAEFSFVENGLKLRCSGANGNAATVIDAKTECTSGGKYWFAVKNLSNCAKLLKGDAILRFTKEKMVEILCDDMKYIQLGVRPKAAANTNGEAA